MSEFFSYTVDLSELKALIRKFPEAASEETRAVLSTVVPALEGKVVEHTPAGVGGAAGLRGSIAGEVYVRGTSIEGIVGTPLPYAEVVERGRRPGQRMPPVEALIPWVRKKLGVAPEEVEEVAFLVARKIAAHGFEGARMFEKGWNEIEPWAMEQLRGIPARIVRRVS